MAEVLVVGKKISEMDLVTDIVGDEKIPTGVVGDKAVTTGQLLTYLDNNGKVQWGRIEGDIANQDDLQNQFAQQLATLQNHIQDQGNPHNVTKEQVGLALVDNTADMDKPVSTAVQEALSLKADQTYVDDSLANKTHNSLLGRDSDGAHPAGAILDESGVTQQQVNDLTGAPYRVKAGGYNIGERVVLENGDIVQNVVTGNTADPNFDMTGWEYTDDHNNLKNRNVPQAHNSESIGFKNAQNPNAPAIIRSVQQEIQNGMFDVTRMGALASTSFDSTDAFLAAQEEAAYLGAKTLYVPASADPYNISASLLNVSQGQNGIGLKGEGINMSRLRWVGGAGRLIDAFSTWQYGFSMEGLRLESLAANGNSVTDPALIPTGSTGFHIERSQTNGIIKDVFVIGFDTNIDIGVHAQFLNWQSVQSRYGNVLLNAYGQNSDLNVFDACVFYAGKRKGALLSAPRVVMRDCWFGTSNAFSDPDYVDITIGFQQVRPEDIGKSSSTTSAQVGHSAQHSALIRPRFERGTSNINTAPYIEFKNIDERTAVTPLSPFTIDSPVMPNSGPTKAIRIADNREGIRIIAPDKNNSIEYLIEDVTQADGSVQYVNISGGDKSNKTFSGQSRLIQFNNSFFFGSTVVDKTTELTAGSQTTLTNDTTNGVAKADKADGSATALVTLVRPASANAAKFYIKASKVDLGVVDIAVYSSGTNYKFRMRNIPVEKLVGGASIEIPESENTALTLSITVPANTAGSVIFDKVLMNS